MGNHQTQFVCVGEVLGGSVDTAGMVSHDTVDVLDTISSVTQFGRTCLKTCNAKGLVWISSGNGIVYTAAPTACMIVLRWVAIDSEVVHSDKLVLHNLVKM